MHLASMYEDYSAPATSGSTVHTNNRPLTNSVDEISAAHVAAGELDAMFESLGIEPAGETIGSRIDWL
jgi:hypothetical protein